MSCVVRRLCGVRRRRLEGAVCLVHPLTDHREVGVRAGGECGADVSVQTGIADLQERGQPTKTSSGRPGDIL